MQNRSVRLIAGLVVLGVLVAIGALAYIWFTGGTGEASTPISAPTLDAVNTESDSRTLFRISSEESEVRFNIYEELRGVPTTVVGSTDQVAGDILVDFVAPQNTEVGEIRINVGTLATDNEFRNRTIRGQILLSSRPEYEFASFLPATLTSMPEQVTVGDAFSFQITGILSLKGIDNEVTFDATVTVETDSRLVGTASTVVQRTMYELTIPNAPGVANVGEDVTLELDFVALAVTADATQEATPGS